MGRFAIRQGPLVVNVVLSDADFAASCGWTACPAEVGPGWTYEGGEWLPPAPPAEPTADPLPEA